MAGVRLAVEFCVVLMPDLANASGRAGYDCLDHLVGKFVLELEKEG